LLFACAFLIVSVFIPAVLADPTVEQITIYPSEPLPLSTILFNATILSNESIDEVRLLAQECREDLCFIDKWNESMSMINGVYQTTITLIHKEATLIKYHIAIKSNETWFNTETTVINLRIDENHIVPQNTSGNNVTPGFELVLLFFSAGLLIIRRHMSLKEKKK
jgi:hypothetical protein